MLGISLMRLGAKKKPFYRLVVKEKRSKRDGKYLENLGTYNPMMNPALVDLKHDRIEYWISVGAQPTETVASLIKHNPVQTEEEKAAALQTRAEKAQAEKTAKAEAKQAEIEAKRAEAARVEAEKVEAARAEQQAKDDAEKAEVETVAAESAETESADAPEAAQSEDTPAEENKPEASN
ncbi:MAG: 30S ribosomal protein S16 [Acidobacteria bacterium]|jgi:small subunit ribosomal protein S16|nr:30S ribosomal protein S16 [Acidobacteriota bacterium]